MKFFILGLMVGGLLGTAIMCAMFYAKKADEESIRFQWFKKALETQVDIFNKNIEKVRSEGKKEITIDDIFKGTVFKVGSKDDVSVKEEGE